MDSLPPSEELKITAHLLQTRKFDILREWKSRIQKDLPAASGQTKTALQDHMPNLIDEIVQSLILDPSLVALSDDLEMAKEHGKQRAGLEGYTLEQVLEEMRIARELIVDCLSDEINLSRAAQQKIHRILDRAIIDSGTQFAKLKAQETTDAQTIAVEAQQAAQSARIKAEEANQAKSDFLANMSHEIRTPLGAILGFTELMRNQNLSQSERTQFADIVYRNGRLLSTLINDILDLSKVEAGLIEVELIPISLPSLVADVTTFLKPSADLKGIKLTVDPWKELDDEIYSDPTRLRQILTNMISHAIKFTSEGEVRVKVEKYLEQGTNEFRFIVKDTGRGMNSDQQLNLFKPFVQGDSSTTREFGGTGLGLFLSKKLAIALGGDLTLKDSDTGLGSTFVANFSAKPVHESSRDSAPNVAKAEAPKSLEGKKVLLVEDSPDNRLLVLRYLRSEKMEIEIADNGEEAVQMALQKIYDVILMDIQMPILDGYSATKQLRAAGYTHPIVALTANAMSEEKKKAFEAGCNDHISKPINRAELLRCLIEICN